MTQTTMTSGEEITPGGATPGATLSALPSGTRRWLLRALPLAAGSALLLGLTGCGGDDDDDDDD